MTVSMALLDNIVWHTLNGAHRSLSVGTREARRYAPGFSPILGFADPGRPDLDGLAGYCQPGERLYCDGWSGEVAPGWRIEAETTMFKMVWDADMPAGEEHSVDVVRLRPEHASQALALAVLTNPGPFGPRTIELGEYLGIFDGQRLVAMAGERFCAGAFREISGVCTHPEFQGRGLARRLTTLLVRRQQRRGETPFLHVVRNNVGARRLYASLGFRDYRESVVRVIAVR